MKWFGLSILLFFLQILNGTESIRIIRVANEIAPVEGGFKESLICNLSEEGGIYECMGMTYAEKHVFLASGKPLGVFKVDLKGKVVKRVEKQGQGPGEFEFPMAMNHQGSHIVFLDLNNKVLFYDLDLNYLHEIKFPRLFIQMVVNDKNEWICPIFRVNEKEVLFGVFSDKGTFLRGFGSRKIPEKRNPLRSISDAVFTFSYNPAKRSIWSAQGDGYTLKYFVDEQPIVEIRERDDYFKIVNEKDKEDGKTYQGINGRPIRILEMDGCIFYFYRNDKRIYCDVFDLQGLQLLKRHRLQHNFSYIEYDGAGTFYGIDNGGGEDDVRLYSFALVP